MNKLKLYMRTKGDIKELVKLYEEVFDAQVLKTSFINKQDIELNKKHQQEPKISYVYLKLLNDISVMIASHYDQMPSYGYSQDNILYIEDKELFLKVYEKIKASKAFKIDYEPQKFAWGTTIFKAYDKWNNGWVLETRA